MLPDFTKRISSLKLLLFFIALISGGSWAKAADPYGNHDEATCTLVRGWACDADNYNAPVDIHFYADGPAGQGGRFIGATTASVQREAAVSRACGNGTRAHGFSWPVPGSLKDNQVHRIYAHAINIGGGNNPLIGNTGRRVMCPASWSNLYIQPSVTSSSVINQRTLYTSYGFPLPPPAGIPNGQLNVIFWRWNTSAPVSIATSLRPYTGFTVPSPYQYFQKGKSNSVGVTSIQWYGTEVGMLNVPASSPHVGQIMPITVQQTFDPNTTNIRPWPSKQHELAYTVDVQIPYSNTYNAINYAQAYLAVRDATSGKWFWIGGTVYDSRAGVIHNGINAEYDYAMAPGVSNPIVSSSYLPGMSYTHIDGNSSNYRTTSTPWSGYRTFHFLVSYGELQQAITDIKEKFPAYSSLSTYPPHYKLYGVFFLSEVYHDAGKPAGNLGMSVRNMWVRTAMNRVAN